MWSSKAIYGCARKPLSRKDKKIGPGRADLNSARAELAVAPRTALLCARSLRCRAETLECSRSAVQNGCAVLFFWKKCVVTRRRMVGTGRFELCASGARGRPSHSFTLRAFAALPRETLGVLAIGQFKACQPQTVLISSEMEKNGRDGQI